MSTGRLIGAVGAPAKRRERVITRADVLSTCARWADQETGRFVLWAPVLMICGVVGYFSLPMEPEIWLMSGLAVLPASAWFWAAQRGVPAVSFGARVLFFAALGAALATIRTASVEAPVLPRAVGPLGIEGVLLVREDRPGDQRLTIELESIGALTAEQTPLKIRVTWRGEKADVHPGDRVRVFSQLMPPPGPAVPGGFDYGRQLYFEQIGGVGFLYAKPQVTYVSVRPVLTTRIERLRDRIATRIERLTPGPGAPVAAALVTGQRDGIPPDITADLRDTGLAHLLAISGLHMGLVCGLLFFSLRFLFACHPGWASRYPIKKWAAVGGILGGIVYLAISGAPVSAQRAFIMAMIGFLAILFDRRAISLRNVSLAAMVIIILSPEAVMSAGFQMSFAAVMALVATYDFVQSRKSKPRDQGVVAKGGRFFGALFLTSLVAGLATSPMAIFHFNRIATYGLGANLLVMPLFTLIVMPFAVLGLVLMPTGLDVLIWPVVGWALSLILQMTDGIASQPGAVAGVPQWSGLAWGLVMGGMLVLCLLKAAWRWSGVAIILLGMAMAPFSPRPVLMIAEDAGNIGAIDGAGELHVASRRRARFTANQWREGFAIKPELRELSTFACDEAVCSIPATGLTVLYTESLEATAQACRGADIVIARLWDSHGLEESCAAQLFTAESVARSGPVSVFVRRDSYRVKEGTPLRGSRPWVPKNQ